MRNLFCAIIEQAVQDLKIALKPLPPRPVDAKKVSRWEQDVQRMKNERMYHNHALFFLLHDEEKFPHICSLCGVNPEFLRDKIKKQLSPLLLRVYPHGSSIRILFSRTK